MNKQNWYIYTKEIHVAILKNEEGLTYIKPFQDTALNENKVQTTIYNLLPFVILF